MIIKNTRNFIQGEFTGWGKVERIIFPAEILFIISLSIYTDDSKAALISTVCGILYTILLGKGKISGFFFGIIGGLCYSYISFKNAFWGNLALSMCYYLPMYFVGLYKWGNNINSENRIVNKRYLPVKDFILYIMCAILFSFIFYFILKYFNDSNPLCDSITTIFSIIALIITVRRGIEQWYFWFIVNIIATIMWFKSYISGVNCLATIIMWITYTVLAIYFYVEWKKEIKRG